MNNNNIYFCEITGYTKQLSNGHNIILNIDQTLTKHIENFTIYEPDVKFDEFYFFGNLIEVKNNQKNYLNQNVLLFRLGIFKDKLMYMIPNIELTQLMDLLTFNYANIYFFENNKTQIPDFFTKPLKQEFMYNYLKLFIPPPPTRHILLGR
ncbi:hypothetical protein DEFDS_P190 (plasmid) [Deferribacter desulfuricans SSM1]|uniref:Uncharacterized protein n=2 Tax=Deferribacter TaxID=53572 RepID=D3PF18_DEFDS|nr:hypothetical protein DEFDS_P190 [Deferribacter desulfuricans SSM1]